MPSTAAVARRRLRRSSEPAADAGATELSAASQVMVAADGEEDGLYVTLIAPDRLFWLNTSGSDARKGSATIPAHGIAAEQIREGERSLWSAAVALPHASIQSTHSIRQSL